MNRKILCVDDDANILQAYRRQLRAAFEVTTAQSGAQALETAATSGPFAVIVSDLMMPEMDGIELLSRMRQSNPDSVRIMLTGQANFDRAIEAVNEGNIFRFLSKPCPSETLAKALEAGIEQYRLVTAEREMLEKTLSGSIKVLMEMLSLVSPLAFGRALRIQRIMRKLAETIGVRESWEIDMAGTLSQIGCVTVPASVLDKLYSGEALNAEEQAMYQEHPGIGRDLIGNIPRLEGVAKIIEYQCKHFDGGGLPTGDRKGPDIPLGARMLHVAVDYETLVSCGKTPEAALAAMNGRQGRYDPDVLTALAGESRTIPESNLRSIGLDELRPSMILAQDVVSTQGMLLCSTGQEATHALVHRLKNFHKTMGIQQPIHVRINIKED